MELIQFPFSLITLLILLFFFLLEMRKAFKGKNESQQLPPGPRKLPLIGNLLSLVGSLPHHTLTDLAKRYGPLMHLQLGENSVFVVSSPRVAKEVLKVHDHAFLNRPKLVALKVVMYDYTDIAFSPYGEYWRQLRKICALELLSAKKVWSFRSIREGEVWHLIDSILSSSGSVINITEMIDALSNAITCKAVFGSRYKDQDTLIQVINDTSTSSSGFDLADLFPSCKLLHIFSGMRSKVEKLQQKVDQIFDSIIGERTQNASHNKQNDNAEVQEEDLLDVLLRLKESNDLQFPLTSNNIKAVIFDMFAGGTSTSSTTIQWAMSEMIRNPRVMEKAQAEVRQALGEKKRIFETDIQGLSYLKLVIKETLRTHPALPVIIRECSEQCEIDGYVIPKKSRVAVNAWAIGRDPDYWHNAQEFEPERFKDSSIEFSGTNLEYIPFGAGRRMCPGLAFGIASVELPLAQLLYHFNWKLPGGKKPEELDMAEVFGATVGRKNSLHLTATPHSPL
ncbi:hypothetical protein RJ640_026373 [Escallonia rubra]|uniref:Cytochrome P450 n=1 Tax=Escallonia rubra TaxID=112253 RepID=A0AA88QU45_9ASTE|nr:hypothetical protein RJ640_026373 [Escallonia rubra]